MSQDDQLFPDGRPEAEQPQWRQDFPVDFSQDQYVARRDFTKFLVLISFAFVVGQVWIIITNLLRKARGETPLRQVADLSQLRNSGFVLFQYPEEHDPCVLVQMEDGALAAYSQKCTHLSCPVIAKVSESRFHCPCHEGSFDMKTGLALAGPPRRPLSRIRIKVVGTAVYATGVETPV
ncbi:MAG TPA: Rieske 2Fe-2S domain-containing protein [Acidobacteriota bacterium]|nr:Rieske 2Fe-2S domain-containing protein [Acidobacteriota bacterium]